MAGLNHRITTKGSRGKSQAVAVWFLLSLVVLFPESAFSEYRISTSEGEVRTESYWIQGDSLHLYEGGEPIVLSEVVSIAEDSVSSTDMQMSRDALRRLRQYVAWLEMAEHEILKRLSDSLQTMKDLDALRASGKPSRDIKDKVKAFRDELDDLEGRIAALRTCWEGMRIPQRSLVLARDVKYLQLLSLESTIFHMQRYVRTWDPTNREYAVEHAGNVLTFEKSFYDALYQEKRHKE